MKQFGLKGEADVKVNNMSSDNRKTYIYYKTYMLRLNINSTHVSPPRHTGARVGPRGSATWP